MECRPLKAMFFSGEITFFYLVEKSTIEVFLFGGQVDMWSTNSLLRPFVAPSIGGCFVALPCAVIAVSERINKEWEYGVADALTASIKHVLSKHRVAMKNEAQEKIELLYSWRKIHESTLDSAYPYVQLFKH